MTVWARYDDGGEGATMEAGGDDDEAPNPSSVGGADGRRAVWRLG